MSVLKMVSLVDENQQFSAASSMKNWVNCFKGIISTDQIRTVRDDQTSNSNHPSMLANH